MTWEIEQAKQKLKQRSSGWRHCHSAIALDRLECKQEREFKQKFNSHSP
ncbi:hypothetical protein H6F67_17000 [Microcoleus sp. FACHB-1515]|nr:hypothetical protein [Microcoleus sp. FACHB-1515]MBD2091543.1 hypothetical protein [Microcoleus sp. FACHB-1515]